MSGTTVRAPATLLLHPHLTPAAKLIWILLRFSRDGDPKEQLATLPGLSQPTIRKGLAELSTLSVQATPDRSVRLPLDLLTDRRLTPGARMTYGALQLLPGFTGQEAQFTYVQLRDLLGHDIKTVRSHILELVGTGWLQITQLHQPVPTSVRVCHPAHRQVEADLAQVEQRLRRAQFRGEAIMKEYLSLLIDSDQFDENATPGFLVNPYTQELLELDRFYPPGVAFEYQGAQHFGPTVKFPDSEAAARQQGRDLIKQGICLERGIRLVTVRPEDLTLDGMRTKVDRMLPLRDLAHQQPVVHLLERISKGYRRKAGLLT